MDIASRVIIILRDIFCVENDLLVLGWSFQRQLTNCIDDLVALTRLVSDISGGIEVSQKSQHLDDIQFLRQAFASRQKVFIILASLDAKDCPTTTR